MAENLIQITCVRCGHAWYEDLSRLDEQDLDIYKGRSEQKTYRVPCPQCGTANVVTVQYGKVEHG